jgi:hypothetical protein
MLLTGSEDELCGLLSALFQPVAYHWPTVRLSAFPVFVYCKFMQRSAPCTFPPSLVLLEYPAPYAACSFSVSCLLFSFFFCRVVVGVSLSRGLFWFIPGVAVGIPHFAYLLTCWSVRCLPSRFGAGIWWCGNPPVFSV